MKKSEKFPIIITENVWANSQLSIARHYGRISCYNGTYIIVNKDGKDIFECSHEARIAGRTKAIEPGEPADLCRAEFIPIYRKLKRERFFQFLKDNPGIQSIKEAKELLKTWTVPGAERKTVAGETGKLFE